LHMVGLPIALYWLDGVLYNSTSLLGIECPTFWMAYLSTTGTNYQPTAIQQIVCPEASFLE